MPRANGRTTIPVIGSVPHIGSRHIRIGRYYFHMALTVFVIVGVTTLLLVVGARSDVGIHWLVFLTGTVGGVANNYRRLQRLPADTKAIAEIGNYRPLTIQLYVSPLIGGIFAMVLYVLFLGGILQGALFPDFAHLHSEPYETASQLVAFAAPKTIIDAAKLLFWSFVAGFSEAFVPNIIDKLAEEAEARGSAESGRR